jgi:TolB-like protein
MRLVKSTKLRKGGGQVKICWRIISIGLDRPPEPSDRLLPITDVVLRQAAQAKPVSAREPEKSTPPRLSIVVLPFANIGGDPEQEHFVDGVTESLTTDLSRIRGAVVIARNTAFTYKGKALDAKTIGRELNVRYVLEGSVQRSGNRMRVNVQLIDAETGSHLWAERFDKPLLDLFDMQDEIVARLAGTLNAQFVAAEARRAEQAPPPTRWTFVFRVRLGSIGAGPLIMSRERVCFLTGRSSPIPTMSTRSFCLRSRTRSGAQVPL